MNEFTAKKLAEVEAFLAISGQIVERAAAAFGEAQPKIAQQLHQLSSQSVAESIPEKQHEIFASKVDKTVTKLRSMMELYIGDEWDNPVEVLEWCSFFTGAGAAHCALASELDDNLRSQLQSTQASFEATLQDVIASLRATGQAR